VDEVTSYSDKEERNQCSIKLQFTPGTWNDEGKENELRHIGIWMKSKYMISSMTLAVEEGSAPRLLNTIHLNNPLSRGSIGRQSIDC
jgi:hypothetical protein